MGRATPGAYTLYIKERDEDKHEMSIAMSIVDIVEEVLDEQGDPRGDALTSLKSRRPQAAANRKGPRSGAPFLRVI